MTAAIAQQLCGPLGCVGYRFERRGNFGYEIHAIKVAHGNPELAAVTERIVRMFPIADLEAYYGCSGIASTTAVCRFPIPSIGIGRGLPEFCGLIFGDGTGGVTVGAPLPQAVTVDDGTHKVWQLVAAHLSAVFRLRRAIRTRGSSHIEAVMTPAAKILHAADEARHREARQALQLAVRRREDARGALRRRDPGSAVAMWPELVSGRWTLVDEYESDGRRTIIAHVNPPASGSLRELTPRQLSVVRLLRQARSITSMAQTFGITPAAVSKQVNLLLRKLRIRSAESLVKLASCLEGSPAPTFFDCGDVTTCVVESVSSIDTIRTAPSLSPAERDITRLLLDGVSTREIAELRRCAYRTVANQIASIYDKLGVCSRTELALRIANAGRSGSSEG